MNNQTCCIITPSYAPDFERCRLLSETITQFHQSPINHYIIVDQKDYQLFSQLKKANTEIMTVESVLPWWIKRENVFKLYQYLETIYNRHWIKTALSRDTRILLANSKNAFLGDR